MIFVASRPPTITEERWEKAGLQQRQQLHHWHVIQHTQAGKDAHRLCERCERKGLLCRFYRYKSKIRVCGECKAMGSKCENAEFSWEQRPEGGPFQVESEEEIEVESEDGLFVT